MNTSVNNIFQIKGGLGAVITGLKGEQYIKYLELLAITGAMITPTVEVKNIDEEQNIESKSSQ